MSIACVITFAPPSSATKLQVWRPAVEVQPGQPVIRAPLDRPLIATLGGSVLAEYPTFGLVEVPPASLDRFLREATERGLAVRVREDFDRVRIGGFDFPSSGPPPHLPPDLSLTDYTGSVGLYLVQLVGPRRSEWGTALVDAGELVHYYPENTYLLRTSPATASALRSRPFVQHLSVYQPAYKLSPGVLSLSAPAVLFVQLDTGQDLEQVLRDLSPHFSGPPPVRNEHTGPLFSVRVMMDRELATAFARRAEVIWVEEALEPTWSDERQCLVVAGRHTDTQPTDPGTYQQWLQSVGFCTSTSSPPGCYENDTKVGVFDSGIDKTWCYEHGSSCTGPNDHMDPHLDFGAREVRFFCGSTDYHPSGCRFQDLLGSDFYDFTDRFYHGTANASVIAGDPIVGTGASDPEQYYLGSGVAPMAEIVTMKLGWIDQWYQQYTAEDFADMVWDVKFIGTRIVSNSWNYEYTGYNTISQRFDQLVRDAYGDWNSYIYPMTIVFSAGNYGDDDWNPNARVMTPATAKNVITVGGSESYRTEGYQCGPYPALGIRNLAYYSTRGVEGDPWRYKPEIVAPSTGISAAQSRHLNQYGHTYTTHCGTSAAAPVVAGAAVLADAWYYAHNSGVKPSPAMIKAMLVAHADDLYGGTDRLTGLTIGYRPSFNQGFGRVSLDGLFQTTVATTYLDEDHTPSGVRRFVNDEGPWSVGMTVADPEGEVLVVLAFTDRYHSANQAPPLAVNNLDLMVHDGGSHYFGNRFDATGYSIRTVNEEAGDGTNNVELIRIRAGEIRGNDFTVEVIPFLSMHAVPGLDSGAPNQDFALYVYNGS